MPLMIRNPRAFEAARKLATRRGQLDFGDCLSHGCAKMHGGPMLFKGEDFEQIDVVRA